MDLFISQQNDELKKKNKRKKAQGPDSTGRDDEKTQHHQRDEKADKPHRKAHILDIMPVLRIFLLFPDEPLLPGAALVALMAELAAVLAGGPAAPVAVERAVFRHRVSPGEALAVAARQDGRRVHATVTSAGRVAAWASLRFAPRP